MHTFRAKHELRPPGLRDPFLSLLLLLAAAFGAGPAAQAQQDAGYIIGTVSDQTGAAVPGATINITWQSTELSRTLTTDASGFYSSEPLQVGQYTVTAKKPGFSTATVHDVIVDAAARVQTNLTLHVGEASANVTVQAAPPVMDTTDAMVGNTIDTRDAQQLPVNGRSVLALATLSPGVESAIGAVSEGFQNRGTQVSAISIDGGPAGINENILDGVSNTQDWLGEIAINLKSDAVSEYHMVSGVIPAQFGYTSGGVVDVVTRSGSNAFHGSVYEFFRNDVLDAEVSFPRPPFGKQQTRFNNYGGTLGGPIRHNKAFIFGNYEQYNYASNNPSYFTLPTAQEYTGNFSDLGQLVNGVCTPIKIYDDNNIVGGQRQQFDYSGIPNNIPPSRLDPVALAYEKLFYPAPNNTSGSYNSCTHANDYVYGFPVASSERQGIVRSDNKISDKDNVMARYAYYFNATNFPFGSIPAGLPGNYDRRNDDLQTQDAVLSETHVFSSNLLNDARIGMMLSDFPFQAGTAFENVAGKIGLPKDTNISAPYMNNGVQTPNITVGFRSSTSLEFFDDLTWVKRNHTLHIGGSVEWTEGYNNQTPSSASGQFNFIAGTTAQGNDTTVTTGTGNAFASYLLGQVNGATQVVIGGSAYRRMLYAGYIQDDWRVSPRLTINAGLRYDMQTQAVEKHNGIEDFNINEPNPTNSSFKGLVEYAGTNGYGRNFVKENFGDYGPRLGFAYSLDSKSATVLRGGVAIYYPSTAVYTYDQSSGNSLGYTSYTTTWTSATAEGVDFQLQNGFPTAFGVPLGVAGGENAFLGQSAAYIDPIEKDPSAQVFSLTVSRQLPWETVVDVSYVGNHGNHFENYSPNLNFLSPQYYSLGTAALSAQMTNPNAGLVPGSLGAATLTQAQLLKPFPYMSAVTMEDPRNGYYWSNQALLSVQRRVFRGLQMMGAYTFGKMTDAGVQNVANLSSVGMGTSASPQDPYNPHADHSLDTIDATHRVTISGLYDLPFGKGQRFANGGGVADHFVSGWQFNSIFTMQSGYPIGITGATNQGIATRPNWNPNVSPFVQHQGRSVLYKTGKLEWFNPQAFTDPADYSFGNVPREIGNLFGPGTVNIDMSLFKTTHITERTTFEFRIEAYNALNHPNLPMPGTAFTAGAPASSSNPYAEGGLNTSSTFGMISSGATTTRNVQLGAKIVF